MKRWHWALLFISFLSIGVSLVLPLFDKKSGLEAIRSFFENIEKSADGPFVTGDPPFNSTDNLGYELLDNGSVFHMWNNCDSYYFNRSNGVQFSNHYEEYWTHNVLMLGYYAGDAWNLLYRVDELSGFTEDLNCSTDDYINVTLWKDMSYGAYDFRLALRYHLKVNDSDLTIIPYIKNLGIAIPFDVGFGWKMKNIRIANVTNDNYLWIGNNTITEKILLNQTLNESWNDLENSTRINLVCTNPSGKHLSRNLYLSWNKSLDYRVTCKSRANQYNAPTTLFIKVGALDVNQEKYTVMNWLDADDWLGISSSELLPGGAGTGFSGDHVSHPITNGLNGVNTCVWLDYTDRDKHWFILDLGQTYTVKKFRSRSYTDKDPIDVDLYVDDTNHGGLGDWGTAVATGVSTWQDSAAWVEVDSTDKDGRYIYVEIDTTEDGPNNRVGWGHMYSGNPIFDVYGDVAAPSNNPPTITGEVPSNSSTGISLTPQLYVLCNDADNDNLNATWWSNSSSAWVQFASNWTSFANNTNITQTFTNASAYSTTYWWSVNLTDGTDWCNETYHFATEALLKSWQNIFSGYAVGGNITSANEIFSGWATGGNVSAAQEIFSGYAIGGNVTFRSWQNIFSGYAVGGNITSANEIFSGYAIGGNVTFRSWQNIFSGYAIGGNITSANEIFSGWATGGNVSAAQQIFSGYATGGNITVANEVFSGYAVGGNITSANQIFSGWATGGHIHSVSLYPSNSRKLVRQSNGTLWYTFMENNDVHVAWSEDKGVTWDDVEVWGAQTCMNPSIAVDSNDIVHLVFGSAKNDIDDWQLEYSNSSDWTTIVQIRDEDKYHLYPSLAIDSNDNLHVVYEKGQEGTSNDDQVAYINSMDNGGSWGTEQIITDEPNNADDAWYPCIAIDNNDVIHVVFKIEDGVDERDVIAHMKSSDYGVTWTTWDGDIVLATASNEQVPCLVITDDNDLMVTGHDGSLDVYYRYNGSDDSGWSNGAATEEIDFNGRLPSISVAANGSAYIIFEDDTLSDVQFYHNFSSSWVNGGIILVGTYDDVNAISTQHPTINGAKTNRPKTGYAFVVAGNTKQNITYHASNDLTWDTAVVRSWQQIFSGYAIGGNQSAANQIFSGYAIGGNQSAANQIFSGYAIGGNQSAANQIFSGYAIGGNVTFRSWHQIFTGYASGGHIQSWENVFTGYASGGNVSRLYQNIVSGWASGGNFSNVAPVLTGIYPADDELDEAVPVTFGVTVIDDDGDNITIRLFSNRSGTWIQFTLIENVTNGSYYLIGVDFNLYDQNYYWYVNLTDENNNSYVSSVFKFTTISFDDVEPYTILPVADSSGLLLAAAFFVIVIMGFVWYYFSKQKQQKDEPPKPPRYKF